MNRASLLLLALPLSLLADGGLPNHPYLYVEGTSETEKPADMVTLRFDLVVRSANQAKANQENQAKATKVLSMLDERKIAQNDVVATDLRAYPEFERDNELQSKTNKITGYRVSRSFTVKVRDVSIFPKLVDDLLALGDLEFAGIDAGLSKEKDVREDEWDKAFANAQKWAERTLKPAGMKIDSIYALSPVPFLQIEGKMLSQGERVVVTGSYIPEQPKFDATRYRLDTIKVGQSVHVIYLISPAR